MPIEQPVHEWLVDIRTSLKLGQDEVDRRTRELGARVSQSYLSQLERGIRPLEDLNGARMDALRRVYQISPNEWLERTGLAIVTKLEQPAGLSEDRPLTLQEMIKNFSTQALINVPLPEGLIKAIKEYGSNPKYAGLNRENVQRQLSLARFYDGRGPQTAVEWLTYYLSVKDWIEE